MHSVHCVQISCACCVLVPFQLKKYLNFIITQIVTQEYYFMLKNIDKSMVGKSKHGNSINDEY